MNYLLVVLLLFLLFLTYFVNERKIISISFITTIVFLLSALTFVAMPDYFPYVLQRKTIVLIVLSIILLLIGECIGKKVGKSEQTKNEKPSSSILENGPFKFSKIVVFCLGCISLVIGFYSYYILYQKSLAYGNPGNFLKAIFYMRSIVLFENNNSSPFLAYFNIFFQAYSYVHIFMFLYNKVFFRRKDYILLFPLLGTAIYQISTTERIGFIRIIVIVIVIYSILVYSKKGSLVQKNKKIIKLAICGLAIFLLMFFGLGIMSGRSVASLWSNTLGNYLGAPILGLDSYIQSPWGPNEVFGQIAFRDIYEIFNILGGRIPLSDPFLPFFYWENGSSNVFTSIAVPLHDFGIFGFCVTRIFIGIIYGFITKKIESLSNIKGSIIVIVIYGLLLYPIFMSSISDSLSFLVQLPTIYLVIFVILISFFQQQNHYFFKPKQI